MSTPALLLTLLLLAFLAWTAWYWFARRRRVRPLTAEQKAILEKQVAFYRRLSEADKERFEQGISQFLEEVTITGVETEVAEADRLLVAASAAIPVAVLPSPTSSAARPPRAASRRRSVAVW